MRARTAAWLAWASCALTLSLVACVAVFTILQGVHRQGLTFLIGVVSCALVGGVVASRRPHNPVGWFFVFGAACFAVGEATFRYAVYGIVIDPGSLPMARAMAWP